MKRLLCFMLLVAMGSAYAQTPPDPAASSPNANPCNVPDPKTIRLYYDWQSGQQASCAPGPVGKGTLPTIRFNAAGIHGWAWCPTADGGWSLMFAAATWETATRLQLISSAAAIARAADPVNALSAVANANINLPMSDPSLTPVWCPNIKEMYASKPADVAPPPPPVVSAWSVVPALSGSRPLFSVVNGALAATGQRVTALASPTTTCDCAAARLVVGSATYCAPVGKAPLVTLCQIKP